MQRPGLEKTAYELLRDRKPSIAHLRCFGYKCFVHNNGKDNLGKFDPRSDEAIFVDYSMHSRAYKVYNKRTMKIEESIHVPFDESKKGIERIVDSDDEDFVINYTEEERVPVSASDTYVDEYPVPIPASPPEEVPVEDSEIREEDQVEDSEVLEETTNEDMGF